MRHLAWWTMLMALPLYAQDLGSPATEGGPTRPSETGAPGGFTFEPPTVCT